MEQYSPLKILSLSALPAASDYAGALVRVGGSLYWSDGANWQQLAPAGGGGFSGVRLTAANFSVANDTWTLVSWATQVFDLGNYWASTQPTRLTIPSTGYYLIIASAEWDPDSGSRGIRLKINGATVYDLVIDDTGRAQPRRNNGSILLALTGSDYLEVELYHNSGDPTENVIQAEVGAVRMG
ncbi:hypothetical protein Mesil_1224 [Allomeiothermus silvanus DSM 9946]|uniref:Uncharacterized protein n=1 Tax=Allomeiothermus silvanus (strain ATCC 700542 / DSM 9946 / NBRC 106475 / NCIMB 13440 / VI-R2) TaxID=526227 RepID=D7BDX0_ALLS1|nr:hypothetical protein [Allomeiothermus silvanus]ADH63121.1 hypothetical protein Mesil_1224 [Allomeiothermus silvanus DSM 9946]